MIAPARGKPRTSAARPPTQQHVSLPAWRKGWVTSQNLAQQDPESAVVLLNAVPTLNGIRMRGGKALRYTAPGPAISLFDYAGPQARKFVATASGVFDVVSGAVAAANRTSGTYSTCHMATPGGIFLIACNGTDVPMIYDGTSFAAASLTFALSGRNAALLSQVWAYANRAFFVERGTLNAWFLPVDSIGGQLKLVSLSGVFKKGGALKFGATWSLDTGGGLNSRCVFVTDKGECAVYRGTNPESMADWALEGVYDISPPLGIKAHVQVGGDLIIATEAGLVPLTEAVRKDRSALTLAAISAPIADEWRKEVAARGVLPFELLKWPGSSLLIVGLPPTAGAAADECLVCNLDTNAWAKWTGFQTRAMALFDGRGWYCDNAGRVYEMEAGGSDAGQPYVMTAIGAASALGAPGAVKTVTMGRLVTRQASPHRVALAMTVNYDQTPPSPPSSPADYATSEWDSGRWDQARWDSGTAVVTKTRWTGIGKTGFAHAPVVQVTSGVTPLPRVEIVGVDVVYEAGGVVV